MGSLMVIDTRVTSLRQSYRQSAYRLTWTNGCGKRPWFRETWRDSLENLSLHSGSHVLIFAYFPSRTSQSFVCSRHSHVCDYRSVRTGSSVTEALLFFISLSTRQKNDDMAAALARTGRQPHGYQVLLAVAMLNARPNILILSKITVLCSLLPCRSEEVTKHLLISMVILGIFQLFWVSFNTRNYLFLPKTLFVTFPFVSPYPYAL